MTEKSDLLIKYEKLKGFSSDSFDSEEWSEYESFYSGYEQGQTDLINDIKQKIAKLEENTTITDFPFDLLHLLKSIEPIKNSI